MKSYRDIFRFMKPYFAPFRKSIAAFVFVATIFFSLKLVQPFLLGTFVDRLMTDLSPETIWQSCLVFLAVAVLSVLLTYYVKVKVTRLQCRIANHMKERLFAHFQRTSPAFHLRKDAAVMADKVNNDVELLMGYYANLGIQFFGNILSFLLAALYIFYVDLWCGVAVVLILPLLGILYRVFKDRIFKASQAVAENRSEYFSKLSEQFHAVRFIRLNQLTDVLTDRFKKVAKESENRHVAETKISFPYAIIIEQMDTLLKIFLFAYGGYAVLLGRMTIGQFTILYSYMTIITTSFSYFLGLGQQTQQCMAYYTRLKELSDVPEEGNGNLLPEKLDEITTQGLSFGYDDREILTNMSLTFRKDQIYCLAGRNGAGKSTLANLLLGLYVSETGETVCYNGTPIRDIDLYQMRKSLMGVSEQEPTMLSGTVGFNITYQEEGPWDTERLKKLFEVVNFQNSGCTTTQELLELDACALSGGQKQKVSIVKALYKNPQLLLLDEPTSALDADSRRKLAQYLQTHADGRITILITHDEELIHISDEVIHLKNAAERLEA